MNGSGKQENRSKSILLLFSKKEVLWFWSLSLLPKNLELSNEDLADQLLLPADECQPTQRKLSV